MADDKRSHNAAGMTALGDRLRDAREKKGLTIGQAQKETHVQAHILRSLEDGSCESSLNSTYIKSFLKKYSEYLGLDPVEALNEYKKLHPETETVAVNRIPGDEPPSKAIPIAILASKVLAAGVILIAVTVFAVGKIASYWNLPKAPQSASAVKAKAPLAKTKPSMALSGKTALAKKDMGASISKNVQLKLLLKVNKNVLVKVRADGVLLSDHVLTRGTAEIFTADNTINIFAADGESIELVLNGKAMGSPGKGVLKNIEATRSGIRIR